MNRNEKIAVALFLVDSLPDVEIVEKDKKQEMNAEDEASMQISVKLNISNSLFRCLFLEPYTTVS